MYIQRAEMKPRNLSGTFNNEFIEFKKPGIIGIRSQSYCVKKTQFKQLLKQEFECFHILIEK